MFDVGLQTAKGDDVSTSSRVLCACACAPVYVIWLRSTASTLISDTWPLVFHNNEVFSTHAPICQEVETRPHPRLVGWTAASNAKSDHFYRHCIIRGSSISVCIVPDRQRF